MVKSFLEKEYPNSAKPLESLDDIPKGKEMVYILTYKGKALVVGKGKYNRAQVIFDGQEKITTSHYKALLVRAYHLAGANDLFERFVIECNNDEAREIEKHLHSTIRGNTKKLYPDFREVEENLFNRFQEDPWAERIVKMAWHSSFDGLADLRSWRKKDIIPEDVWKLIEKQLGIPDPKKTKSPKTKTAL